MTFDTGVAWVFPQGCRLGPCCVDARSISAASKEVNQKARIERQNPHLSHSRRGNIGSDLCESDGMAENL